MGLVKSQQGAHNYLLALLEVRDMWSRPRIKYVCIPCRMVFRDAACCTSCRGSLRAMYNFEAPRKRDDRAWKKIELSILVKDSNIQLCTGGCCVPIGAYKKRWRRFGLTSDSDLTLSQYKARIRKRRTHHQGEVPQYRYS